MSNRFIFQINFAQNIVAFFSNYLQLKKKWLPLRFKNLKEFKE